MFHVELIDFQCGSPNKIFFRRNSLTTYIQSYIRSDKPRVLKKNFL